MTSYSVKNLFFLRKPKLSSKLNPAKILLYHCNKQYKKIENLQFTEQNIVISLPVYCDLRFLCLSKRQIFFSSWTQYSPKF